jgi:hypothetical protein
VPRISIRQVEDLNWEYGPDDASGIPNRLRPGRCFHHSGTKNEPQLYEARLRPDETVPPHGHEQNEIIYILSGELHLGSRVLKAGSSVSILGGTIYSFKAGSEGVHFLNFRPCSEIGYLTVDEMNARRARGNLDAEP